ncbi:MAG: hypothetical protein ACJ77K_10000 [Bacteroidia bacterium]
MGSCKSRRVESSYVASPPMTVINIMEPLERYYYKISFQQSARSYEFSFSGKKEYLDLLKESMDKKTPVIIYRQDDASTMIVKVRKAK